MITADSSVWIGYLNGAESPAVAALDELLDDSANEIVMLDVVLMEILRGFRHERDLRTARALLAPLPVFTAGGQAVAEAAVELYRDLRRVGVTVRSSIDLLIGAWCIRHQCLLVHSDRDFEGMARHHGLSTWTPA